MGGEALTRDQVLDAAEEALRRFGPGKTTVVDVARALGVSHGTVYRHFASKAELTDSVLERWVSRILPPLAAIAQREDGPATDRMHTWLVTFIRHKRGHTREEPDLFAAYALLARDARTVVRRHTDALQGQLARIVATGMARGEFAPGDPGEVARAVLDATSRFYHPAHAAEWAHEPFEPAFESVWKLVLLGLSAR